MDEKLRDAWDDQVRYNHLVKMVQDRASDEWIQTYLLGVTSKVGDVLDSIYWKFHRNTAPEQDTANLPRTLADITKYVFSMWQEIGYGPEDMLDEVEKRNTELSQRWHQEVGESIPAGTRIIVSDLDGTLADFVGSFLGWVRDNPDCGLAYPEDPWIGDTLHLDLNYGWNSRWYREAKTVFEREGGYANLTPFDHSLRWLQKELEDPGTHLHVWTARPQSQFNRVWSDSWSWLSNNGLWAGQLHIGSEGRIDHCLALMERGHEVVLLEDNPTLALRAKVSGVNVLLNPQPYNKGLWSAFETMEGIKND